MELFLQTLVLNHSALFSPLAEAVGGQRLLDMIMIYYFLCGERSLGCSQLPVSSHSVGLSGDPTLLLPPFQASHLAVLSAVCWKIRQQSRSDWSEYNSHRVNALGVETWLTPWGCWTSISGAHRFSCGCRRAEIPCKTYMSPLEV